jgi:hypothetical protein
MRKLAEFVQLNCTSSISIANFRLQARVLNSDYKGFDAVNNDNEIADLSAGEGNFVADIGTRNSAPLSSLMKSVHPPRLP